MSLSSLCVFILSYMIACFHHPLNQSLKYVQISLISLFDLEPMQTNTRGYDPKIDKKDNILHGISVVSFQTLIRLTLMFQIQLIFNKSMGYVKRVLHASSYQFLCR